MIPAAAFFALAALSTAAGAALYRAAWPERGPAPAILLWQALGLCWGWAVIGTVFAVGLAPYGAGVAGGVRALAADLLSGHVPAPLQLVHLLVLCLGAVLALLLAGALVLAAARVMAARRWHRALLELVGHPDERAPGALVLDHPAAAAYCLPGHAPGAGTRVVVSEGTLRLLEGAQLAAVLDHERAHARGRHDLVLLPFRALALLLPARGPAGKAFAAVELLVEMCADDHARRGLPDHPLAAALLLFSTAERRDVPSGALGVAEAAAVLRARRLLAPQRALPARARCGVYALSAALVALPVTLALLPGG